MKVCDITISFVLSLTLLYKELGLGEAHEMDLHRLADSSMQAQAPQSYLGMLSISSYRSSYV